MARSKDTILQQLVNSKASQTALALLTSTSSVSWWYLMLDTVATGINYLEQLFDTKKAEYEAIVASAPVHSAAWYRQKMLEFQYGSDVEILPDFSIGYAIVNESQRITKFASVHDQYALNSLFGSNGLTFSFAKGSTPTQFTAGELIAAQAYMAHLIQPGVPFLVQTGSADLIKITCEVRYDARYQANIQANVFAAIRSYIENLEDGILSVDTLFSTIDAVAGVETVIMSEVKARQSGGIQQTIFSAAPGASVPSTANQMWYSVYGYMIEETNGGETWTDTIVFTPIT